MDQKRLDFLNRTQDRLQQMDSLVSTLTFRPGDKAIVEKLAHHFHQLAGSGGIYELDELCEYAAFGERVAFALMKQKEAVSAEALEKLRHAISLMRSAVDEAQRETSAREQSRDKVLAKSAAPHEAQLQAQPVLPGPPQLDRRATPFSSDALLRSEIYIVSGNLKHVGSLERSLKQKNFKWRVFQTASSALSSLSRSLPEALVIEIPLTDGSGYELVTYLRNQAGGSKPPVVLLSKEQGFLDKVQAIRSGVDCFFEQPLDFKAIVEKLQYLLDRDKPERFRILSVEDEQNHAEFIQKTLESAGYNVLVINDPKGFEEAILAFCPDLLLLDVMMGDINGFELAKFVRQNERFATLPILFLTTQNQLEHHIESARAGGDDYLIKPIAPQLLVATVAGRLERYRVFQKMLKCEGLTQCLTHSAFIERAQRLVEPHHRRFSLVLMIVDIDGLRNVNDRYGFPAGDKVIVSMANLLKTTFRHSETIGRIGGDSFAVMAENLAVPEVGEIGTQLLHEFESMEHIGGGQPFHVTASAGVAAFADGMDLKALLFEAEMALRAAKEQGRNRLVRAAVRQV
ncbi:MAG TPA: response regulator [Candidatus Obscuribacterales bacterium]